MSNIAHLQELGATLELNPSIAAHAAWEDKNYRACILLGTAQPFTFEQVTVVIHHEADSDEQEFIAGQVTQRLKRIADRGLEHDAWMKRSDGDLQLWLTLHQLDPWLQGKG